MRMMMKKAVARFVFGIVLIVCLTCYYYYVVFLEFIFGFVQDDDDE